MMAAAVDDVIVTIAIVIATLLCRGLIESFQDSKVTRIELPRHFLRRGRAVANFLSRAWRRTTGCF